MDLKFLFFFLSTVDTSVYASVISNLDYCISLLMNLSISSLSYLKSVENSRSSNNLKQAIQIHVFTKDSLVIPHLPQRKSQTVP